MDILKEVLDSMPNSKELELDDVLKKNIPSDGSELSIYINKAYSQSSTRSRRYLKLAQEWKFKASGR